MSPMPEWWFGPKHPDFNEMPWLRDEIEVAGKKAITNLAIREQSKRENPRYIGRPLPPDYKIECVKCGWTGLVRNTIKDNSPLTPAMQQAMKTNQKTGTDLYCPACQQHIITQLEDEIIDF